MIDKTIKKDLEEDIKISAIIDFDRSIHNFEGLNDVNFSIKKKVKEKKIIIQHVNRRKDTGLF